MQRSKREDFENDEVNGIGNELTSRKDVEDERYRNKKKRDVESMESDSDEYQTSLESDGEFQPSRRECVQPITRTLTSRSDWYSRV